MLTVRPTVKDRRWGSQTITPITQSFCNVGAQFISLTGFSGSRATATLPDVVYKNVPGRSGGAGAEDLVYWSGELASGSASQGALAYTPLDSTHTFRADKAFRFIAESPGNNICSRDSGH